MFKTIVKSKFFLYAVLVGVIFEALTVSALYLTYGHAGPEGKWGFIGWISLLPNILGIAVAAFFDANVFHFNNSLILFWLIVFIAQCFLIGFISYLIKYITLKMRTNKTFE